MAYTTQPNVDDYMLTIVCLKRTRQLLGSILMSSSPKVNILRIQKPFISIMSYDVFDLLTQEARLYPITPSTERGRRLRQIRATGDVSVEAVYFGVHDETERARSA